MNQNVPNRKDVIFGKILRLKSRNLSIVWRGTVLPQSAAFCGSPPRSAGALARPLSPESAAFYWRSGALYCRNPPLSRYCLPARQTTSTKRPKRYISAALDCNGGQKATVLPQSAALLWRPTRLSTAPLRLALQAGWARLFCRNRRAIMAAHAPLYCRTPPRSTGGLCATVLPRSAALYYCRGTPRRAIMAAWTAVYCREPPRCTGGLSAAFLPRSAALYSLALLLAQSSLPRCAGGLFSAPIFVKYEIPVICISFL